MTDESNDIDKAEFDERLEDIEGDEPEPEPAGGDEPELLDFSDLLDLRDGVTEVDDQLDQTAGYYAQTTLVLEQQAEAAEAYGEDEKAAAIEETAEKAREIAERIDGGAELMEMENEIEAARDGE